MDRKFHWGALFRINGKDPDEMSLSEIKEALIDNFDTFWEETTDDDAEIVIKQDDCCLGLMIEPSPGLGYYLSYSDENNKDWVSVYDITKKAPIESYALINAAEGLYLPPELAWEGIKTFLESGTMSDKIHWVKAMDLPDDVIY